jgi:hypothetical protein
MNGILHWNDAVAYFGNELKAHRLALGEASMATHCLLACRSVHSGTAKVVSGDGEHAERRLLQSTVWKTEINTALSAWHPHDAPMLVLVVLNRSPCADCAHSLADALHKFNDRYALTTEKQHFVLASLGYYHSNKDIVRSAAGLPQTFTTDRGMRALAEAGWKLCALDFGQGLTLRGREFHAYLQQLQ